MSQQSADSTGAAVNLEVEKLGWHSDFRAFVETNLENIWVSWKVVFCSALVMGTCEVLLQVRTVLHAVVESLELRIQLEGLVAQMHGIVNVRHENKICNAWLRARKVESAIIQQLTDNFKAIQALDNSVSAVTSVLLAERDQFNELIICKSL